MDSIPAPDPPDGLPLCQVLTLSPSSEYYFGILCLRDHLGPSPSAESTCRNVLEGSVQRIVRLCPTKMNKKIVPKKKYFFPFINRGERDNYFILSKTVT